MIIKALRATRFAFSEKCYNAVVCCGLHIHNTIKQVKAGGGKFSYFGVFGHREERNGLSFFWEKYGAKFRNGTRSSSVFWFTCLEVYICIQ